MDATDKPAEKAPKPTKPQTPPVTMRAMVRTPTGYTVRTYAIPADVAARCLVESSPDDVRPRALARMSRDIEREFR
jgi:hypothetical protein